MGSPYPTVVSAIDPKAGILKTIPPICLRERKANGWLSACVETFEEHGKFAPCRGRKIKRVRMHHTLTTTERKTER